MYKFSKSIDINFNNDYEEVEFGVSLQSNTQFTFLECDYIFYRANCGHKEELFIVNYYSSSNNKEDAEKKLEISLKTLSYFLLIPLYDDSSYARMEEIESKPELIKERSKKKIKKLEDISERIKKFRKTRKLFDETILIFYAGLKFHYMLKFYEDSFLNYFKIVEKICKYEYKIRLNEIHTQLNTQENQKILSNEIKKYLNNRFNIEYSTNKINDLQGKVMNIFLGNMDKDVFSKIILFCKSKNLNIDVDVLGKTISIRNDIAHGEIVTMEEHFREYGFIYNLCLNIISKKFFDKLYKDNSIDCKAEI